MQSLVRASQETHYVSATKPNRLMLFTETVAVYCENHTETIKNLNSVAISPQANYTDRATAVCRRS
jgi:hypothetical protein